MRASTWLSFLSLAPLAACTLHGSVAQPAAETSAVGVTQLTAATACQTPPAGVEDLSAFLEPIRQQHNLPALGAAVVTPDGVKAIGVTGYRRYGDGTPACVDDAFLLASNTKAMTAVAVARAVEQGRISWSTTIGEVFSDIGGRNPAYDGMTLDHLLSHRAGFSHDPTSINFQQLKNLGGSLHDQREHYARIVLREQPQYTPGSQFSYSNTDYTLAGLMVERRTGQTWEEFLRANVFAPLGMSAGFGPTASSGQVNGLWPHTNNGGTPVPQNPDMNSINPLFRTPAGNVHMPMASWARFAMDELRGFEGKGALLSPASYQRLHNPPFGGTYAYGWFTAQRPWMGGTAYDHTGSDNRNFSLAWLVPQRRVAILVATNEGKSGAALGEVVAALRQHIPGCATEGGEPPPTNPEE